MVQPSEPEPVDSGQDISGKGTTEMFFREMHPRLVNREIANAGRNRTYDLVIVRTGSTTELQRQA